MRLTRSHVDAPLQVGDEITLPDDVAAHLLRVLRLQEGDACVLFNGDGNDYDARIEGLRTRHRRHEVVDRTPGSPLAKRADRGSVVVADDPCTSYGFTASSADYVRCQQRVADQRRA